MTLAGADGESSTTDYTDSTDAKSQTAELASQARHESGALRKMFASRIAVTKYAEEQGLRTAKSFFPPPGVEFGYNVQQANVYRGFKRFLGTTRVQRRYNKSATYNADCDHR